MKKIYLYLLFLLPFLFVTTSCEDESETQPIEDLFFGDPTTDGSGGGSNQNGSISLTTLQAQSITGTTAELGAEITNFKLPTGTKVTLGVLYGLKTDGTPTLNDTKFIPANIKYDLPNSITDKYVTVQNLRPQTEYVFRAYAKSDDGKVVAYGSNAFFTTVSGIPIVRMGEPVYSNNRESVNFPSELVSLGGASSVKIGWLLSQSNNPTFNSSGISDITDPSFAAITSLVTIGAFGLSTAQLPPNVTFYLRMYAINNNNGEVVYSNTVSFMLQSTTTSFSPEVYNGANYTNFFIDDFVDNRNNWIEIRNNDRREFYINNGVYFCKSKESGFFWLAEKEIPIDVNANFEIEMSYKMLEGNESIGSELRWGARDIENSYRFILRKSRNVFIDDLTNNNSAMIRSGTFDYIRPNDYNKITIRKYGNKYYFFINGEKFYDTSFKAFKGNKLYISAAPSSSIEVDYLYIRYITN